MKAGRQPIPPDAALVDWSGRQHEPAGKAPRIVSLVPSITELLFDLDLGPHVVGRTHYCVHPEAALASIPSVGGTKKIVMRRLQELAPTHVIVNVDENPKEMAEAIAALGIAIIVTHPAAPEDNLSLFRLIGGIFDRMGNAEDLCTRLLAARDALTSAATGWADRRVLYLIWRDPWMTVSRRTYIAQTLALARWHSAGDDPSVRYPEIAIGRALLESLDLVLFSSEPYPFKPDDITAFDEQFPHTRAARILIDGEMVSWYGSRAIAGLRYLKDLAGRFAAS